MRYLVMLLLAAVVGCTDSTVPEPAPTEIRLGSPALSLGDGDTARVAVEVLDQYGAVMSPLPRGVYLTWTSSAPAVVWVAEGLLTALRPGAATVTVQAGEARRDVEVVVRQVPSSAAAAAGDAQQGTAGLPLADSLAVRVVDRHGDGVPGVPVSFRVGEGDGSVASAASSTGPDGVARAAWVLGPRAGSQSATAEVPGVAGAPIAFRALAAAGAPAELLPVSGDGQTAPVRARLPAPLVVRVRDAHGNPVAGAAVAWSVATGGGAIAAPASRTDNAGTAQATWTLGSETGRQGVAAAVGALPPVLFSATAGAPASPSIDGVSPAVLTPGATATVAGSGFGATVDQNRVTVAGVAATVLEASPSRLTIRVPSRDVLPCGPAPGVPVTVAVDGRSGTRSHPLEVATNRALAVGQSLTLRSRDDVRCNRLPQGSGRYLVSVFNTGISTSANAPFELRGGTGGATSTRLSTAPQPQRSRGTLSPALQALSPGGDGDHLQVLEANRALLQSLAPRARERPGPARSRMAAPLPAVGDTLWFRIPTLGASSLCSTFTEVRARAVYVGRYAVVWEDVASPLAGQMDPSYQEMGQEYDGSMHDILLSNFGNPLAADGLTDGNGRVFMLFSKVVNDSPRSVAGFVFSGDLFRRADCASSDGAEIFYARVPTSLEPGFSSSRTRDGWLRSMRATIIHEVKHLTSYAERLAAGARSWEENWLEESTARVAEEIWARTIFGYAQRQNTTYQQSVHCEVRPTVAACAGSPLVMLDHFAGLHQYARSGGALTPLGRTSSADASYYGSGWSLVRWAVDHASATEAAVLRALTREATLSGIRNLEARTGRSFPDMLADWSLALAADDRPGFTPARPQLTLPSWNLRDLFGGMNRDFPSSWGSADPLPVRRLDAGSFSFEASSLRGGSAVVVEIAADGSGAPVVELRGSGGTSPPATLGISILRVQ